MPNYQKEKPKTIKAMFNNIAQHYDMTNRFISFNLHKGWNRHLANHATKSYRKAFTLLDLCAGTGEVAFECMKDAPQNSRAYLLDFSSEMLNLAKSKAEKLSLQNNQIEYIEADAQKIPLPAHSIDCTTIAYGIRNVKNPAKCFQEVFRVLKTGGNIAILEATRPNNRFLRLGHQLYTRMIMPLFGKFLTKDKQAYQYLCSSVQNFISSNEMENLLRSKGFHKVKSLPLAGGVATIITAYKP